MKRRSINLYLSSAVFRYIVRISEARKYENNNKNNDNKIRYTQYITDNHFASEKVHMPASRCLPSLYQPLSVLLIPYQPLSDVAKTKRETNRKTEKVKN